MYDIDPLGVLRLLREPEHTGVIVFHDERQRKRFCTAIERSLAVLMEMELEEFKSAIVKKRHLVLTPAESDTSYCYWLGLQLSVTDTVELTRLLDYQWSRTKKSRWFLQQLEYYTLRAMKSIRQFNNDAQRALVVNWIRESERNVTSSPTHMASDDERSSKATRSGKIRPHLKVESPYVNKLVRWLEPLLADAERCDDLKEVLSGKTDIAPIRLNCSMSLWIQLFKTLIKEQRTTYKVTRLHEWVIPCFRFYDDKKGKYVKAGESYVRKLSSDKNKISDRVKAEAYRILRITN